MADISLLLLDADRDAVRLQHFLERCSDYYELHEGWPTPSDAGEYELSVDPKMTWQDLSVFAREESNGGALQAIVQIVRNCPEQGTWWIALLVVAPELRSRGFGAEVVRQTFGLSAAEGATTVKLAVSLRNPRGQRFWENAGFRDTGVVRSVTARSGHVDQGRIMVRELEGAIA